MSYETENWKSDEVTRSLPSAPGHEKSVLSTMLQDSQEFIPLAIELMLTPAHFYFPGHSALFSVMMEMFAAGEEIELVTMTLRLSDSGRLEKVGGPSAMTDIYTYAPSPQNFRRHVTELRTKFAAREMLRICRETTEAVFDSPTETLETLERMERDIMAIRDQDASEKPMSAKQAVAIVVEKFEAELRRDPKSKGISTGFEDLDRMTGGLKGGEMFVIGARPSVGKTSYMMNIAEQACLDDGIPTLVFSAEMTTEAITKRLVFARAKFALSSLSRGYTPTKGDLQRIQRASLAVSSASIHFDDKSSPPISYIVAKARRLKRDHGIGLICIDYLGLIKSVSGQSKFSREREIAEISAGIKGMAKDLNVPVILLAQLNREVEKRATGKVVARPRMSDLKDSGAIEADADIIGLLSREAYQADEKSDGSSCLDIVKNRNGATGPIPLNFIEDIMRFEKGEFKKPEDTPQKPTMGRFGN